MSIADPQPDDSTPGDDDAQELLFWRGMSSPTRSMYARVSATWMDDPPTSNETLRSLIQGM